MSIEDRAQEHEARIWESNNAPRPAAPTYKPGDAGYGPEFCDECDDPMPALRRANGWHLCTTCKSLAERAKGRR